MLEKGSKGTTCLCGADLIHTERAIQVVREDDRVGDIS